MEERTFEPQNTLELAHEFLNHLISQYETTVETELAIDRLLEELGNYVLAEGVYLLQVKNGFYLLTNQWRNKQKQVEQIGEIKEIHVYKHERWSDYFKKGKSVFLDDIKQAEKEFPKAYQIFLEKKITSLYAIPILDKKEHFAVMVVVNADAQRMKQIQLISNILFNWLSYRLKSTTRRTEKILSGLGRDYTAVYMINLDTDHFETIINQESNNVAKEKNYYDFTSYLRNYADKYVIESDRENMKKALCIQNLKQRFVEEEDFYFRFTSVPNILGQTHFEAHAVHELSEEGNYAILGFRCINFIVEKELEYQKKIQKAYELAKQQLDIFTEAVPGGIKISRDDPTYSFKYVSKQYARMLGYTVEELMEASGGSIAGIAHPDDLEWGIAEALDQYTRADYYSVTYRMKCKDGTYKYIEDHGHKVRNKDGSIEHWNLILDKNELVEKTIALESEKQANLAKTEFLARMSHDMKTPLNGIIGLLEYDSKHPDDYEKVNENRKKALIAANHLLSLVNDVLELNKLKNGNVTLYEEEFNMEEIMKKVKNIAGLRSAESGINFFMDAGFFDLKYPYLIGSPMYVKRVFVSIITNAIKFNQMKGNVWCHLLEESKIENEVCYKVSVKDDGIGMSKEFVDRIFEPFTQERNDARGVYKGTGIGMAIVKNLVERMQGQIEIKTEKGKGTEVIFSLNFPLSKFEKMEEKKLEKTLDISGLHILLVDDNALNREIAGYLLEDEGVVVSQAKNGQEAIDFFLNKEVEPIDLILMDVMMPVMDGVSAAREIRRLEKIQHLGRIPIFAMTANAFIEEQEDTKKAGMDEHLTKPLEVKTLIEKIYRYCKDKERQMNKK